MLLTEAGKTLPGWRDFERSVATVFGGQSLETKFIFDVLFPDPARPGISFGLSCKMRRELDRIERSGRVLIEISNASGEFSDYLRQHGVDLAHYREYASQVGPAVIRLIEQWHHKVSVQDGGAIDTSHSFYLVLSWSRAGWYQLHQFPLHLLSPDNLRWSSRRRSVVGKENDEIVFEWFPESGGQLKYYPPASSAVWTSKRFALEPLPADIQSGLLAKQPPFFPQRWADIAE